MSSTRPRGGSGAGEGTPWVLHIGHDELVIRKRYEVISIVNDILIGLWFVIGSVFFFYETLSFAGTCLFVAGSVQLLIRPTIRLARHVHLRRLRPDEPTHVDASHDF